MVFSKLFLSGAVALSIVFCAPHASAAKPSVNLGGGLVSIADPVDPAGSTGSLTLSQTTQIPGQTLKAGDYTVTIVDHLTDRMIMRIDGVSNKQHVLFLAVPGSAEKLGSGTGPAYWQTGLNKTQTIRGFTFANGARVEFVFAKAEAAVLAKENSAKVLAVDPQSEGHTAIKNLSKDEMTMINLWMLSLTTTGVDNKTPAVLAQRWDDRQEQAPVVASSVPPQSTTQVASVEQPAAASAPTASAVSGGASRPARRRTVIAQLPHTASDEPLVWGLGLFSLVGFAVVRRLNRVEA